MKKTILFIAVLFAGFSGFWYYSAEHAKQFVVSKFDEAASYFDKEGYTLKNEGIDVKGFPFKYVAVIKSPSLQKKEGNESKNEPIESIFIDGQLNLASNLLGTHFSVEDSGKTRIITQNKDGVDEFILSGTTASSFSVERGAYFESISHPFRKYFEEIEGGDKNFLIGKSGSFSANNLKLFNVKSPSVTLLELDKGDIYYELNDRNGNLFSIKVSGDIKGLNLDTLIVGKEAYTPGSTKSLKEIAMLLSLPKPGKTAVSFDFDISAPFEKLEKLDEIASLNDLPPFNFNIKKVDITNNFGHYFYKGLFSFKDVQDAKQFHLGLQATSETTKAQFASFKSQWEEFLNTLPICAENNNAEENRSDVCPMIKGLIPELDTFGKVVFEIEANLDVKNPNDFSDNSKLAVNHFNYYSALYGMKSNGFFDLKKPEMVVSTYDVELLNYQHLFQDLYNYVNKVKKVIPYLTKDSVQLPNISEGQVTLITDYLKAISNEPEKDLKDLKITITINGPDEIKVGTLSMDQFTKTSLNFNEKFMKELETPNLENQKTEEEQQKN